MVRHTDMEMPFMKEEVDTHRSLKARGTAWQAEPHRKEPVSGGREGKTWM